MYSEELVSSPAKKQKIQYNKFSMSVPNARAVTLFGTADFQKIQPMKFHAIVVGKKGEGAFAVISYSLLEHDVVIQ